MDEAKQKPRVDETGAHLVLARAELARPLSVTETQAQINIIQQLMRNNMKQDVHYGLVPGAKKLSLWKAGAELIASVFHIATDPQLEDLSIGDDLIRYRIRTIATRQVDGVFLGAALGEARSDETKYQWRAAIVDREFEDTPIDRRRIKYEKSNNRDGFTVTMQVRAHAPDVANTILKMSSKRSLVAVILVVTAASDIFTQDIEDLPAELRDEMTRDEATVVQAQQVAQPQRTSETKADARPAAAGIYVTKYRIAKETDKWTLYKFTTSDGVERATFDAKVYATAKLAADADPPLPIAFDGKQGDKGYEVTSLEILK